MTKAEERAFEYQMSIGPNVIGGARLLSEDEFKKLNTNRHFKAGYEQAEKDVLQDIRQVVETSKKNDEELEYIANQKENLTDFIKYCNRIPVYNEILDCIDSLMEESKS